jgi:hypothetical protein
VLLLGVEAKENARGVMDVLLFDTRMSVPTKGTSVNIIEGSGDTGRVFFAGEADNDVYEFLYQVSSRLSEVLKEDADCLRRRNGGFKVAVQKSAIPAKECRRLLRGYRIGAARGTPNTSNRW